MSEEAEKDTMSKFEETLVSAISDTFKKYKEAAAPKVEVKKEEAASIAPEKPEHTHKWMQESDGFLHCENGTCQTRYVKANSAEDLLNALNKNYHPETHDTFNCPTCTGDILKIAEEKGHKVKIDRDKGMLSMEVSKDLIDRINAKRQKK